jgi:predicted O-linked N-acetylglucosamine transferase (SPINDLY family)
MTRDQIHRAMQQAVALHNVGRLADAEKIYRDVLQKDPRNADALQLLGLIEHQKGNNERAIELIRKAITIRPRAEFYVNLAQAQRALGRTAESLESTQRAVQMAPNIPEAWNNLGSILKDLGRPAEAVEAFRKAIALRASYAVAQSNHGNALAQLNQPAEAEASLRRAIAIDPNYAEGYSNLAHLLTALGRLEESVALCRRAIALKPQLGAAYSNLGKALHGQGMLGEGNEVLRRGAAMDPNNAQLHENLLGGYNHTTRWSPAEALAAHIVWSKRFAEPATPPAPHTNDKSPDRVLRIGFVSPDLRRHSVTYFLEPIIAHRDRGAFQMLAYSNNERSDEVTERLRAMCDGWRDIRALDDDQAAALIRQDRIDILIDLAGHTMGNRLGVFGRKPAPVQMTYLGYANTTGLRAIDYRITDSLSDPPGMTDAHYTEKLIRLSPPFLCYRPPDEAPPVADSPMLTNGFARFGSFNNASKIREETIALWSRVLAAVPNSRLVLKARALGDAGARRRIFSGFAAHGIDAARLELIEAGQSLVDHLGAYRTMDVALDTFPYNGTTTTCEAMWMGVPVVSRAGQTHVSRVGLSLLTSVGHRELATETDDAFVTTAVDLASNPQRLTDLRRALREQVRTSPLCQAAAFSRRFELALRDAWRAYCAT